jgi:hypothetical protein
MFLMPKHSVSSRPVSDDYSISLRATDQLPFVARMVQPSMRQLITWTRCSCLNFRIAA